MISLYMLMFMFIFLFLPRTSDAGRVVHEFLEWSLKEIQFVKEKKIFFVSTRFRPCYCWYVRPVTVNLSDFYSYRLIGKLTAFLQLQEFSQRNLPVDSSTSTSRLSLRSSREKLAWLSLKQQPYVLILT